jgi:hypothetical protein
VCFSRRLLSNSLSGQSFDVSGFISQVPRLPVPVRYLYRLPESRSRCLGPLDTLVFAGAPSYSCCITRWGSLTCQCMVSVGKVRFGCLRGTFIRAQVCRSRTHPGSALLAASASSRSGEHELALGELVDADGMLFWRPLYDRRL